MITIRKLGLGDVDEFIRLRLLGLKTDPTSFGRTYAAEAARPRSDFTAFLAPSRHRVVWGAFRGETLVGLVRLEREGRGVRRHIYSLYVSPNGRRQGLARRLLKTAIIRAKRCCEVREIQLSVNTTNASALCLYRSLGFSECSLEENIMCVAGTWYSEYTMRKFVRSRAA